MEEGFLGHLFPHIDQSICVDCGLCRKSCPSNAEVCLLPPKRVLASWAKDVDEYKSSASGGLGAILAMHIISMGGVVYGCACLRETDVRHIRVDSLEELYRLKGSKYVQSRIGLSYSSVKKDLNSGKRVMFIGTPCQVAGLKSYLGKDYEYLIVVDLICHGVPSLSYLKHHIERKVHGRPIDEVRFRSEGVLKLVVVSGDSRIYESALMEDRYDDTYYNTFIDGYTYRDSCYECRYAKGMRISDLTIGDFWSLKRVQLGGMDHSDGLSCVLVNTGKGESLMNDIQDYVYMYDRTLDEAQKRNPQLVRPKCKGRRIRFFQSTQSVIGIPAAYRIAEADHILKYRLKKLRKK